MGVCVSLCIKKEGATVNYSKIRVLQRTSCLDSSYKDNKLVEKSVYRSGNS